MELSPEGPTQIDLNDLPKNQKFKKGSYYKKNTERHFKLDRNIFTFDFESKNSPSFFSINNIACLPAERFT